MGGYLDLKPGHVCSGVLGDQARSGFTQPKVDIPRYMQNKQRKILAERDQCMSVFEKLCLLHG